MTALDDLDTALARMQGDDSGGPLAPALDAARRARAEQHRTATVEHRIRREARALIYPLLALCWVVIGVNAYGRGAPWWTDWLYTAFALLALSAWIQQRPPLPGDANPRQWIAFVREHPAVGLINIVLAISTGIALAQAIGEHTAPWITAAGAMLGLCVLWFAFIVSRTRPSRPAERGSEST